MFTIHFLWGFFLRAPYILRKLRDDVILVKIPGIMEKSLAWVAELVDAHGLGPCEAIHGGSSPLPGTFSLSEPGSTTEY